ncbi:MAG: GNAT family N-acetyltransferase, partial [Bacteroidales bacterium]|nr:GNAT family N-acetyltransferase [Bacteroidales bacterium]
MKDFENIELVYLKNEDYDDLLQAMKEAYSELPGMVWGRQQVEKLIKIFPEGQAAIKVNGEFAGCALSIIVDYEKFENNHKYVAITGNYSFNTHTNEGDVLYGIEIFIRPKNRGMRLGRRLYDFRKELCERLNLRGIAFGGRIPNYHKYSNEISPKEYIEKVRKKEIHDPVLDFQMSNDFHPAKVLKGYLEGDNESNEYAVLLEWDNIYYEKPHKKAAVIKTIVRLGLIQWQMRTYKDIDDLM